MFGVGAILEGAFRLVREQLTALAAWAGLYLVANGVMVAIILRPAYAAMANPGIGPNPAAAFAMNGTIFLYDVLLLILILVLYAAAFRAVLRPEQRAYFYLRLGMDELRLLGLGLLIGFVAIVAFMIGLFVISLLTALLTVAISGVVGGLIAGLLGVVLFCGLVYAQVRFSLAGPLSIYRGHFVLGESWQLTQGRFWPIFLAYLVLFLMIFVVQLIISAFTVWPMISAILRQAARNPQDPAATQAAMAQMMGQFTGMGPMMIALMVVGAVIGTLWIALTGGAAAVAAGLLVGGREAEAFE